MIIIMKKINQLKRVLEKRILKKRIENNNSFGRNIHKNIIKRRKEEGKKRSECQGKLINLTINNNKLLIEIKKQKQELSTLKNRVDKTNKEKKQYQRFRK